MSQSFIRNKLILVVCICQPRAGCDTRSIFKENLTGFNSNFTSPWLTKAKNPNLANYSSITGERIIGFILFRRVLALC